MATKGLIKLKTYDPWDTASASMIPSVNTLLTVLP